MILLHRKFLFSGIINYFQRFNQLINGNVLETCKEMKVKKLVSCLSTCIFPDKVSFPIDETMVSEIEGMGVNFLVVCDALFIMHLRSEYFIIDVLHCFS